MQLESNVSENILTHNDLSSHLYTRLAWSLYMHHLKQENKATKLGDVKVGLQNGTYKNHVQAHLTSSGLPGSCSQKNCRCQRLDFYVQQLGWEARCSLVFAFSLGVRAGAGVLVWLVLAKTVVERVFWSDYSSRSGSRSSYWCWCCSC